MTGTPSRAPAIISVTVIIAVVAAVITIALLYGGGVSGVAIPAAGQPTTTGPESTTTAPPTTTGPPTTGSGDTVEVTNPDAPLTYSVPRSWAPNPEGSADVLGVRFGGVASFAPYTCGGAEYSRAFAVSAAVQSTGNQPLDPRATAEKFAAEFGTRFYPGGAVGEGQVGEAKVAGRDAALVAVPVTVSGQDPECSSTAGLVSVLAVDLGNGTTTTKPGVALLVLVADTRGGPDEPAPAAQDDLRGIITSVKVG